MEEHTAAQQPSDLIGRELAIEQAHVDRVYAQLNVDHDAASRAAAAGIAHYEYQRGDYMREEDGTSLFERDAFSFAAAQRLAILDSEHEGLVFGRLDESSGELRYIGRIGVRTEDYEPLVIDWRAPAAEPFYRATSTNPMAMVRRRVLQCRSERVVSIQDDLLDPSSQRDLAIIGEGALMASLSRARGTHMRDIVATIQAEQDEAIRAPYAGFTFISGGPGTGKTVVALHRAAYLLYSHRRRLEKGGVLVIGPSEVFMDYIERVLPSLGEDAVTLRSVGQVSRDVTGVRAEAPDEPAAAEVKGSLVMADVLRNAVLAPLSEPEFKVVVRGEVLRISRGRLRSIRRRILGHHLYNRAADQVRTALLDELWTHGGMDLDVEREKFDDLVADSAQFAMFCHAWWPPLSSLDMLRRLADADLLADVSAGLLEPDEIATLSASLVRTTVGALTVADTALLDELHAMLGPVPPEPTAEDDLTQFLESVDELNDLGPSDRRTTVDLDPDDAGQETFAHILVDEAQDITPMQWRMLRRRGPQASWTIIGDLAQSSWHDVHEVEQALNDLIGTAPHRRFRMSTNYRSPAEVFELAADVVRRAHPGADFPTAIRSTGIDPLLLATTEDELAATLRREILTLAGAIEGSIGVIAPAHRLPGIREALTQMGLPTPLRTRVVTVTPLQAKGLEYDAAVVVDPDGIADETAGGVRVLYVALTRPTQRLVTIDVNPTRRPGEWTRALPERRSASA